MEKTNMRGRIMDLNVGGEATFPIEKLEVIRVYAANIGAAYGRKFKTSSSRVSKTVTVKRVS